MYLLDTNIVSATSPIARSVVGTSLFSNWLRRDSERLFLSAVTIAEIETGIARADRIGATTKVERLRRWLASVEHLYADRILAFGIEEARHAGVIVDRARAHDPGFEDVAIAATAAARGFHRADSQRAAFRAVGSAVLESIESVATQLIAGGLGRRVSLDGLPGRREQRRSLPRRRRRGTSCRSPG